VYPFAKARIAFELPQNRDFALPLFN
jgi:hypothetical protein